MNKLTKLTEKIIDDVQELIDVYKAEEFDVESLLKMSDAELKVFKITFRLLDNTMELAKEQAELLEEIDSKLDMLLKK